MKPNDKALDEALSVTQIPEENMREYMRRVLTAAYAAQFPPSEDYARLIDALRTGLAFSEKNNAAADALEALLAERDALKAENNELREENENIQAANRYGKDWVDQASQDIASLRAERDALLARLAPVEDEALVEIVTRKIFIERKSLAAAIAAIRPHIEAAERERCAKIAELHSYPMKTVAGTGYNKAAKAIAAAIRSGK